MEMVKLFALKSILVSIAVGGLFWGAFADVYEVALSGSFDELVSTNGEYSVEGRTSSSDMYGYEISLSTESQLLFENSITNARVMYAGNFSDNKLCIKSVPSGVQELILRYDVELGHPQTNSSVVAVSIERSLPQTPNTIKNILSSFPNLRVLRLELDYNGNSVGCFDISECVANKCLRQLNISSSYPFRNIECLSQLKMLDSVSIEYHRQSVDPSQEKCHLQN